VKVSNLKMGRIIGRGVPSEVMKFYTQGEIERAVGESRGKKLVVWKFFDEISICN
jgi:hypothetical protein